MTPYQFGIRVGRAVEPDAALARFADAIMESDPVSHQVRVYFDRYAPSLVEAVVVAVRDLDSAGVPPEAAVPDDDLITLGAVAARLELPGRTVGGLLHHGPPPLWHCANEPVYRWAEITSTLRVPGDPAAARVLEAANLALRLRRVTGADPALAPLRGLAAG
jgi:hypothetical protein